MPVLEETSHAFWLDVGLVKSAPQPGKGDWIIYITASTPRVDYEGERVLPQALQDASQYFLDRGKVTFEHVSSANRSDASVLIGEPIAMRFTSEGKTLVRARLYKHMEKAKDVWNILRSGGKLGASIGGAVLSRQTTPGGVPTIDKVHFSHLAITAWPVNNDTAVQVTPYQEFLSKSFLRKALGSTTASGTSSASLVLQDLEGSRERGMPVFQHRWEALTEVLQQMYRLLHKSARKLALAVLVKRGEGRRAYVSASGIAAP